MAHAPLILLLVFTIVFLFICMVLSAISAGDIKKNDLKKAHTFATITSVMCGITLLFLIISLIYYVYSSKADIKNIMKQYVNNI